MEMNDLIKLLKEQHQFLETFLNNIISQQSAIINGDIKGLEETIKIEGSLLINFDKYKKIMPDMIQQLSLNYSLSVTGGRLSDFVKAIRGRKELNSQNIIRLQSSLHKLMSQIVKINNQNKLLVEQARNFIKDTISVLIHNNENPILDRKI